MNKVKLFISIFLMGSALIAQDKPREYSNQDNEKVNIIPDQNMPVVIPGRENQDRMPMAYIDPNVHYHLRIKTYGPAPEPEKQDLRFRLLPDSNKFRILPDTIILFPQQAEE